MEVPTLAHTAAQIEGHGATVTVTYEKKNGNGRSTYSGRVTDLLLRRNGDEKLTFKRDDEQKMYVQDGELYTVGSSYPFVGKVVDIEIDNSTTVEEDWDDLSWEDQLELI